MNVLLFGATGMVGQGVLDECLRDPLIKRVVSVSRQKTGRSHPKLKEIVQADVTELKPHTALLRATDGCFFCLGVSALGMSEERYTRTTYDLTLAVARQLVKIAPEAIFIYVSGLGTDSSEQGRAMWARVKGRTENALLALPLRAAYMFRPGLILAERNARSKTRLYRFAYALLRPLFPLLKRAFPNYVTTTGEMGRAMIAVVRGGYERRVLEARDIIRLGRKRASRR